MRKCAACGYLRFGDGDTCNHCGAAIAVAAPAVVTRAATTTTTTPEPKLWKAPPVPPPAAGVSPAPPPSPAWAPPPPGDAPLNEPPPFAADGIWRPDPTPLVTGPSRSTARHGKIAMILVVALLFGGVAYAVRAARNALPAGTSAYVEGKGTVYTSPDETFAVRFPVAPLTQTQPMTVQGAVLQINEASVEADDYEMAVANVVLPVSVPDDQVDQLLDDSLKSGFAGVHGTIKSSRHITRGGLPAVDAQVKGPDGYGARVEVIIWNNRMYLFGVHAKSGVDRLFVAMDKSLELR